MVERGDQSDSSVGYRKPWVPAAKASHCFFCGRTGRVCVVTQKTLCFLLDLWLAIVCKSADTFIRLFRSSWHYLRLHNQSCNYVIDYTTCAYVLPRVYNKWEYPTHYTTVFSSCSREYLTSDLYSSHFLGRGGPARLPGSHTHKLKWIVNNCSPPTSYWVLVPPPQAAAQVG